MSPGLFRLALAAVAAAGCSTETGVLVEVTRDESVPADVRRLEFFVGVDAIADHPSNFVDFDVEDSALVSGRDLIEDPYRLMLRTGDYPDSGIMVAVVAYGGGEVVGFGALDQPVPFVDGKVTLWEVVLSAGLPDGFVITPEGCLRFVDGAGNYVSIGRPGDLDCDGYLDGAGDCNDLAPGVNEGAGETCGNGIDEDCDQAVDENVDDDADQVTTCDGDCDDGDPAVNPSAGDPCDGVDNDCNGACDDAHDGDGDAYTVCGSLQLGDGTCLIDDGKVDCDDEAEETHPGAAEVCDGADNDCDGVCDDDSLLDRDGDGYTECGSVVGACGALPAYVDCAPEIREIHPGAPELCDGVDSDCDQEFLETDSCFARDPEGGGGCSLGTRTCAEADGSGEWVTDCAHVEEDPVPVAACDAWDDCAGDPDPVRCAGRAGRHAECAVNFEVAAGAQCPGRAVALATDGSTTCSWTLVGGTTDIGGYLVGLLPADAPDGTPVASLEICDAVLSVTSALETPPAAAEVVFLVRSDVEGDVLFAYDLASLPNASCSPPDGLVCSGP